MVSEILINLMVSIVFVGNVAMNTTIPVLQCAADEGIDGSYTHS